MYCVIRDMYLEKKYVNCVNSCVSSDWRFGDNRYWHV